MTTATDLAGTLPPKSPQPRNRSARIPSRSLLKPLCLAPVLTLYALLFVLPLLFLLWVGFWRVENFRAVQDFSLNNYAQIFADWFEGSRYGLAMVQSLWVASTTAIIAVIFSFLVAMALVFALPERGRRLGLLFVVVPFWSSYVLRLYSWQTILATNGVLNAALTSIGLDFLTVDIIFTQAATRVGLVHFLTPILVVILFVTLSSIDRTLVDAARELGATRWQAFTRVILPLSGFGIASALSFAVIISMGDVLAGALLGGGAGGSWIGQLPLYALMIMTDYAGSTNLPRVSALATILVLVMVALLAAGFALANAQRRKVMGG
ncbi:MAG: ABC transporter permease [Pseudomonadota bacterium]